MGGLLRVQRELNQFNASFYADGRTVDLAPYLVSIVLLYVLFNFVPTFVALARQSERTPRIVIANGAVPAVAFAAIVGLSAIPGAASFKQLVIMLIVVAGAVSWISTMIDAAFSSARADAHRRR